jgi:transposase
MSGVLPQLACASMSQNNTSIIYAGLDIHKATLQLHLTGRDYELPNTPAGHSKLLALITPHSNIHVICEASGGYERQIVSVFHAANTSVSVLNPAQARHFARALGQRAKTDPLDARLLSLCGEALKPAPTPPRSSEHQQLVELVRYRGQLMEKLVAERQQAEMIEFPMLRRQSLSLVRRLEADLAKVDALLTKLRQDSTELAAKAQRLTSVIGVGNQTALSLLAEMPELGTLNRRQAASLAGLAPHPRQSGQWVGKSSIGGGRPQVRRALYMAALCASRLHPSLSVFYQRLRAAGKPAKVALTAVMRKLLIFLNLALKYPQLSLAS